MVNKLCNRCNQSLSGYFFKEGYLSCRLCLMETSFQQEIDKLKSDANIMEAKYKREILDLKNKVSNLSTQLADLKSEKTIR